MNENQINTNAVSVDAGAVRVFERDRLDDFPVLKAFQQYIDAEQNKARKRMIVLCVFFGFLVTVMATAFMLIVTDFNGKNKELASRNQELNDKLVEYVMKGNERESAIARQHSNEAALKSMSEAIASIQRQITEQQEKADKMAKAQAAAQAATAQAAAQAAAKAVTQAAGPTKEQIARQRQIDTATQKLSKAHALLKAEKEKLAAEREMLHKLEVELQRRKMYPEYYADKDKEGLDDMDLSAGQADDDNVDDDQQQEQPQPSAGGRKYVEDETGAINYFKAYEDEDEAPRDYIESLMNGLPQTEPTASRPARKTAGGQQKQRAQDHFDVPLEVNGELLNWIVPKQQ